jgi:hypothetical protein
MIKLNDINLGLKLSEDDLRSIREAKKDLEHRKTISLKDLKKN